MLAFFTNSLGVITYAEFKTLFYQSLAKQVKRVFRVPEYRRSRWAKALQNQSAEVDNLNISSDFRLDYSDFTVWLLNIGEGLHAPAAAENYKKLAGESFQNGTLTVANAFYLFSEAYAETLLQKGSNVICNHAFGFTADDVKAGAKRSRGHTTGRPCRKTSFDSAYGILLFHQTESLSRRPRRTKKGFSAPLFCRAGNFPPPIAAAKH